MTHPFIVERNQLLIKIIDLQRDVELAAKFRSVSDDELDDMLDQLHSMENYAEALGNRIMRRAYENHGTIQ